MAVKAEPESRPAAAWRLLGAEERGVVVRGAAARVRGALLALEAGLRGVGLRAAMPQN